MSRKDPYVMVEEQAKAAKYIVLQDGDHSRMGNFSFVFNPKMAESLAKAGVKHFFPEVPKEFQPTIDSYTKALKDFKAGKISPDQLKEARKDFVEEMSRFNANMGDKDRHKLADKFATMVEACEKKGIAVHAIDKLGPNTKLMDAIYGGNGENLLAFMKANNIDPNHCKVSDLKKYLEINGLKDEAKALRGMKMDDNQVVNFADLREKLDKKLAAERVDSDKERAHKIKEITGDDKAAVMIGIIHGGSRDGKNGKDLNEWLGKDKTRRIEIVPDKQAHNLWKDLPDQAPHLIITDKRDFPFDPGHPEVQFSSYIPGGDAQKSAMFDSGKINEFLKQMPAVQEKAFTLNTEKKPDEQLQKLALDAKINMQAKVQDVSNEFKQQPQLKADTGPKHIV